MGIINAAKDAHMSHKPWNLLLSCLGATLALASVTAFTLAAQSNPPATLRPYATPILYAFLDSENVYPESVMVDKCYEFWQREVKRHLLSPHGKADLSTFLRNMDYLASEWSGHIEVPIVLLEKIC